MWQESQNKCQGNQERELVKYTSNIILSIKNIYFEYNLFFFQSSPPSAGNWGSVGKVVSPPKVNPAKGSKVGNVGNVGITGKAGIPGAAGIGADGGSGTTGAAGTGNATGNICGAAGTGSPGTAGGAGMATQDKSGRLEGFDGEAHAGSVDPGIQLAGCCDGGPVGGAAGAGCVPGGHLFINAGAANTW